MHYWTCLVSDDEEVNAVRDNLRVRSFYETDECSVWRERKANCLIRRLGGGNCGRPTNCHRRRIEPAIKALGMTMTRTENQLSRVTSAKTVYISLLHAFRVLPVGFLDVGAVLYFFRSETANSKKPQPLCHYVQLKVRENFYELRKPTEPVVGWIFLKTQKRVPAFYKHTPDTRE